jgi:Ser/Thr protein kinase RdoA (MazF antagonist)
MDQHASSDLIRVASHFDVDAPPRRVQELGHGNVNDTYRVWCGSGEESSFVLQRLNSHVFREPRRVMENIQRCCRHVEERIARGCPLLEGRRWDMPAVLADRDSGLPWLEEDGHFWRAITYIERARTHDTIVDRNHAGEVGFALGMFHALISDLPVEDLTDTLVGFHITPAYIHRFGEVLASSCPVPSRELDHALRFVRERQDSVHGLERAKASGLLPPRPIHGDPKINNVMIDSRSDQAIALIDLDTVKPGLVHYDIGDCLRSACNRLGEETSDWRAVRFDLSLCEAMLRRYIAVARSFLTPADYDHLCDAIRLIPFELGVRFLTDHLEGNPYFKVNRPHHNLRRALVQFRLTESIEEQESQLRALVEAVR